MGLPAPCAYYMCNYMCRISNVFRVEEPGKGRRENITYMISGSNPMIRSFLMLNLILFSFLLAPGAFHAQQIVTAPEKLPLGKRVWIATQIYSSIETYFGHWTSRFQW